MRSLSIAATGMMAQQLHVEVISNNIANMTTSGYKRRRPEFQDLLYQNQRRIGAASSDDRHGRAGGRADRASASSRPRVYRVHAQGNMTSTEGTLDLAIQGERLLHRRAAERRARLHPRRQLPAQPRRAAGHRRRLHREPRHHRAGGCGRGRRSTPSGEVQAKLQSQVEPVDLGQLELAIFANEAGLEAIGNNFLHRDRRRPARRRSTPPGSAGYGELQQGFLESSNVNPVQEMTALITAQRAYDLNSKVITASDEMMATVTQLR